MWDKDETDVSTSVLETYEKFVRKSNIHAANKHEPMGKRCEICSFRAYSICRVLDEVEEMPEIANIAHEQRYAPGSLLMEEGRQAVDFFSISSGTLKLYKLLPDGRRHIIGFAGRGDFLGLTNGLHYTYSAEVLESTRMCRFPRLELNNLFDRYPHLQKQLLKEATNIIVASQEQMVLLGRKTAREKVASFLLNRLGTMEQENNQVSLPMTRADIADYLGLTMETVSRTLGWLKNKGFISYINSHLVRIESIEKLTLLAGGNLEA